MRTQGLSEKSGILVQPNGAERAGQPKVVASALGHADQHEVVHRDIKLENILLANDGQPLVADFAYGPGRG